MGRLIEKCRQILATQRKSDLHRFVTEIAREMKVNITETQIDQVVNHLKYGCVIWQTR